MGQNLRRGIELKFAAKAAFSVTNIKRTIWVWQDEFWKIGFFADLKSVKIENRRIELKFAGYAALGVTNTKRTIWGLFNDLWKIGFLVTSNRQKSKIAVLTSIFQVRLPSA